MTTPFHTLVADPPWRFSDSLPGKGRGAGKHYGCLTLSEIARFPLPPMAKDSVLILWRVSAMVEDAYFIARAWGFVPKAEFAWIKTTKDRRRVRMGMGHQVRHGHESAIIATRGRPKRLSKAVSSVVTAPYTGRHSGKPELFFDRVEQLYPGPYCELFARRQRPGWTCYGNQLKKAHP